MERIFRIYDPSFVIVKLKWSIIEPKSLSVQECVLETDSSVTLEEASE